MKHDTVAFSYIIFCTYSAEKNSVFSRVIGHAEHWVPAASEREKKQLYCNSHEFPFNQGSR